MKKKLYRLSIALAFVTAIGFELSQLHKILNPPTQECDCYIVLKWADYPSFKKLGHEYNISEGTVSNLFPEDIRNRRGPCFNERLDKSSIVWFVKEYGCPSSGVKFMSKEAIAKYFGYSVYEMFQCNDCFAAKMTALAINDPSKLIPPRQVQVLDSLLVHFSLFETKRAVKEPELALKTF